jgi:hypothetical protein
VTLFERHWQAILVGFVAAAAGGLAILGLDDQDVTTFAGAALAAVGGVYLGEGLGCRSVEP